MINRTSYIIILTAAALAVCGCQNNLEIDAPGSGISFNPTVGGIGTTQVTKASDLCSADGSVAIPLWLKVSDGISVGEIAGQARNDAAACNDGNRHAGPDPASSDRHAELDSASDPASAPAIPATKGELLNPDPNPGGTGTKPDKPLSNYATEIGGTFYVSGWKGSTPARFIPSSGSSTYEAVTYSNSKWSTITTDWDSTTDATFYAYANLPASGATVANANATSQVLTYSAVPPAASAQKDILLGYGFFDDEDNASDRNATDKTCTAPLVFHHPLTAVKFVKGDFEGFNTIKFKAIYLSQIYKSGTATMTPTSIAAADPGSKFTWTSLSTEMQEASQESTTDLLNTTTNVIGEPFIIIPQNLEDKPVTITVVVELDGVVNALTTTCNTGSWKAGYTNTYTLSKEGYSYTYSFKFTEETNPLSTSKEFINTNTSGSPSKIYVESLRTRDDGEVSKATWKIKSYYTASTGEVAVSNSSMNGTNTGGVSASLCNLSTDKPYVSVNAIAREHYSRGSNKYWKNDPDRNGVDSGYSPASWEDQGTIDLSLMDYTKDTYTQLPGGMTTANCYVIRHAGHYKLPLVYGNAMKGGQPNIQAYYPNVNGDVTDGDTRTAKYLDNTTTSGNFRLVKFLNHLDAQITSPFIENNTGCQAADCEILWQTNGAALSNLHIDPSSSSSSTTYTASNVRYLCFDVSQDDICQSNALIAIKDSNGDIIWSWHIWTTNDPTLLSAPIEVTNYQGMKYYFMVIPNIGRVEGDACKAREDLTITLEQEGSNNTLSIVVSQPEVPMPSSSTIYQTGRKDPMRPSDDSAAQYIPGHAQQNKAVGPVTLGQTIKNPDTFYWYVHEDRATNHVNWCTPEYYNLWSGKRSVMETKSEISAKTNESDLIKTVYDPSPIGYKVPSALAFTGFTTTGQTAWASSDKDKWNVLDDNIELHKGLYFYTTLGTGSDRNTIFFPADGRRAGGNGEFDYQGSEGYYASCNVEDYSDNCTHMYEFIFHSTCVQVLSCASPSNGHNVRPVKGD